MKSISSKRQAICDEVKSWIGTPFQHQAMVKGSEGGVDCAMLVAGVANNVGIDIDFSIVPNYPQEWHYHNDVPVLTDTMSLFGCVEKSIKRLYPGDIIVFKIGRLPSHLGVLVEDNYVVHAYAGTINKVTMNNLSGKWIARLVQAYKFPGV